MEKKVLAICLIAGFLGLLCAALAFAAEAKRKKEPPPVSDADACTSPRSPAFALGLIAALAVVIAQMIINIAACCMCCKKGQLPSRPNWTVALICLIISWVTFVIGLLLLLAAVAMNNEIGVEGKPDFGTDCYPVSPGFFARAAVLSLASISLGIIYYIIVSSAKNMEPGVAQPNQGISLAQLQSPPQNTQPVFVHEDTYNRQQFP